MSLELNEYTRYGRQMILPALGLPGQLALKNAAIAVVGAGGLGCPALQYLAAAGVSHITVIDHDNVELSNLHRQILHSEQSVGSPKVLSAARALSSINPHTKVTPVQALLTPTNALTILAHHDLLLDCTDNLPTRYLLSDAAVRLGVPLVSGAAQALDGQLTVYNAALPSAQTSVSYISSTTPTPPSRGPCMRCILPHPPAPAHAGSCAELGILGAVAGVIGTLMALEAVKIIVGNADSRPSLFLFSATAPIPFRTVRLRARVPSCPACGDQARARHCEVKSNSNEPSEQKDANGRADNGIMTDVPEMELGAGGLAADYVAFCGGPRPDWESAGRVPGLPGRRVRVTEFSRTLGGVVHSRINGHNMEEKEELHERAESGMQGKEKDTGERKEEGSNAGECKDTSAATRIQNNNISKKRVCVLDVRSRNEFGICALPGSINVPLQELSADPAACLATLAWPVRGTSSSSPHGSDDEDNEKEGSDDAQLYVVCRLGNDSQLAVDVLRRAGARGVVRDVIGGLVAWAREVDDRFPVY